MTLEVSHHIQLAMGSLAPDSFGGKKESGELHYSHSCRP